MTKTLNLKTIGSGLFRATTIVFLALGFFVGFTIVSILTVGLVTSEDFDVIVKGRQTEYRFPIFNLHGQYHLQAHYVSMIGWMLLVAAFMIVVS